jgi:hypothetical protein
MKKFDVTVTFAFRATVSIAAPDLATAKKIANTGFGCASPNYHSNDDRIKNWDAEVHPTKLVAFGVLANE